MELFYSDKYFVLQQENDSLWINRENGAFSAKSGRETVDQNPSLSLIGKVFGYIGTLRLSAAAEPRLVFVRSQEPVCKAKEHEIYKITSVVSLPLESECEVEVESCSSSKQENIQPIVVAASSVPPTSPHGPQQGATEIGGIPTISWSRVKIPACPNSRKYGGRVDRTERRLLDEFYKMFIEADSFYYSLGYNIFNALQRQKSTSKDSAESKKENITTCTPTSTDTTAADTKQSDISQNQENTLAQIPGDGECLIWRKADERFFWNRYMLSELIESQDPRLHTWAIPIMQGSVQHQTCQLDPSSARVTQNGLEEPANLELLLISRRSRHRAGTRYLKRGVDDDGNVANYVETEQIMIFRGHMISFVQTRGSVPVFWSQQGYKYRPPIRLDKTVEESYPSFEKHLDDELKLYGALTAINLVEKIGKEKVLEEAYRKCILSYDSEDVSYITFDFHDKCRGLKFDNVKLLTERVADIIKNMAYCWIDSFGVVMQQNGVFRVNCVDCLDRTNVVQSFLAREVLSNQLSKVGLLMPEIGLSESIRKKFLEVWANNGDIISKQYAGTNALKGDFTRTGERRFAGVMRDGMNSANRYLNNRLKDGTRQACIDLVLGVRSSVTEEELTLGKEAVEEKEITTDLIMQMIEDVKHTVVPVQSVIVGSWGLVNAKTNEAGSVEIDTVLVLTEHECFIAIYDCSLDSIASSTRIHLSSLTSLEMLSEPVAQHNVTTSMWGLFQGSSTSASSQAYVPSLKLYFIAEDDALDFFHFRSSNLRFFNNCLTQITHPDEMLEALKMLSETLKAAVLASCNKVIPITQATTASKASQRSNSGINSWIPRWNTPPSTIPVSQEHPSVEPISRKFSPASMQRFTPSFLKKKRNTAQTADEEGGKPSLVGHNQNMPLPQSLTIPNSGSSCAHTVVINQARTPMETTGSTVHEEHLDLYLPSCGIISLAVRPQPGLQSSLAPEYFGSDFKTSSGGGLSPVTPILDATASQDVTPTSSDTNTSLRLLIPPDLLQRHRYSLPTNSLSIATSPSKTAARSTTPEITITEESGQGASTTLSTLTGTLSSSSGCNQKRMSRSSEDVNKVAPASSNSIKMFNTAFISKVPVSLKNKLVPSNSTLPQDRSTSDQDIFSSLVNMKGSHSESAIKDGNNGSSGSPAAPKRDVVFAPLGKLARGMQNIGVNYLDPRKLRDTLRQPRQDNAPQEDPEMAEKLKTCKSLIIDI